MTFLAYGMAMIGDVQNSLTHVLQLKQKKKLYLKISEQIWKRTKAEIKWVSSSDWKIRASEASRAALAKKSCSYDLKRARMDIVVYARFTKICKQTTKQTTYRPHVTFQITCSIVQENTFQSPFGRA